MSTSLATPTTAGFKILIVDDEKPVRLVAQRMLERMGHHPRVAVDTAEALAIATAAAEGIQAALVDMHLGDEDGLTLARSLRALLPEAPIVIMGGDLDEKARKVQAHDARMHLLAKPFAFADLGGVMEAVARGLRKSNSCDGDSCLSRPDSANIAASNGR